MGTNSIKKYLTKDSIISKIKLLMGSDINKENVYIIVEGHDDIKFLKKFCKSNVTIDESFSGKSGVEEIINSKEIKSSRVIGIRDKDYCNIFNKDRIFFYDKCCLEMMIINFDESFDSIYFEFYNGEMESNELKEHILVELNMLSNIRKYNEEYRKGINFNGLSFNNFIDDKGLLDKNKLIENLKRLNFGKELNFNTIKEYLKNTNTNDLLEITNGHDFILFFKTLCDKNTKKNCASENNISLALRTSFNKHLFEKTLLYKNINNYFDNKVNIWL